MIIEAIEVQSVSQYQPGGFSHWGSFNQSGCLLQSVRVSHSLKCGSSHGQRLRVLQLRISRGSGERPQQHGNTETVQCDVTVYTTNYRPGGEDHHAPDTRAGRHKAEGPQVQQWSSLPSHLPGRALFVLGSHPKPTYHYLLRLMIAFPSFHPV